MVFSSQAFLFIFLPFALLGYYVIRKELRNLFLLLISFLFYAWANPQLIYVLLASIVINYCCGLLIQAVEENHIWWRRAAVFLAIALNLGLLGYFKYYDFFIGMINRVADLNFSLKEIALPLGISFFTFSGISYILDVDLGKIKANANPIRFALFMSFFPKLMQGPIARYDIIEPSMTSRDISLEGFANGINRFILGLAKKVLVADQLSPMVNQIFSAPAVNNSPSIAWLGAVAYTLQIYFDFSGYTDMAIGLGLMFGFKLPENFYYPYISTSITEFWRRWHVTLSSWFRDYVFYPLEFSRRKAMILRQETNILIVFFLTGLWHGAGLRFIAWGLLHGVAIAVENLVKSRRFPFRMPAGIKWVITILILIIGWVIFRSRDLLYSFQYLGIMFGLIKSVNTGINFTWYFNAKIATVLVISVLAGIPWRSVFPVFTKKYEGTQTQIIFHIVFLGILLVLSGIYLISSSTKTFIYFQF